MRGLAVLFIRLQKSKSNRKVLFPATLRGRFIGDGAENVVAFR